VIERDGRAPAVTVHCNPISDPDVVLFRSLADRKDFDSLAQLCRERKLTARDALTSLRWVKDHSIVEALQGNFLAAYDRLGDAHYLASQTEGTPRAKYEAEFGIVHARLGRSSLALGHFNVAYQNYRAAGNLWGCAAVDHNRARALMTRGETRKAMKYLKRALDYARANNDVRLELEVCESVIEFGGMTEGAR
jgi:tetratricopeptide (TPR) repeat protein